MAHKTHKQLSLVSLYNVVDMVSAQLTQVRIFKTPAVPVMSLIMINYSKPPCSSNDHKQIRVWSPIKKNIITFATITCKNQVYSA